MLSVSKALRVSQARDYYEKDDYYLNKETGTNGQWQGKGCERLGLKGPISKEQWAHLIRGEDTNGLSLIPNTQNRNTEKRVGYDLTFSADKSVSILATRDDRIIEAHRRAVEETLRELENRYAYSRQGSGSGGTQENVQTDNLVIGKFDHMTSRELDMQLHSHAVILNLTQRQDGQWRGIENKEILKAQKELGQIYRNELAANLRELGYEIEPGEKGFFSVKGVPQELCDQFSKRRNKIEAVIDQMREKGLTATSELYEKVTLATRSAKQTGISQEMLEKSWREQTRSLGYDLDEIRDRALASPRTSSEPVSADEAVKMATEILVEHEAVFSDRELMQTALQLSMGHLRAKDVKVAIERHEKTGELVRSQDGKRYTTREMVMLEKQILSVEEQGRGKFQPAAGADRVSTVIEAADKKAMEATGSGLRETQKDAIRHILQSQDAIIGVQGYAGTAKTNAVMRNIAPEYERQGYVVRGMAVAGKAADELEKVDIKSQTVDSFLQEAKKGEHRSARDEKQLWIIDEASMLTTRQAHELIQLAEKEGHRILLVGDIAQHQAVGAGGPFKVLQDHGMKTARMDEIVRQSTEEYRQVIQATIQKDLDRAMRQLEQNGQLNEIRGQRDRQTAIIKDFCSDPKGAIIVTGLNKERQELNERIRKELQKAGKISIQDKVLTVREDKRLEGVRKHHFRSYKEGEIVYAREGLPGVRPGEEYRIKSVDDRKNAIIIEKSERIYDPLLKRHIEKQKMVEIDLARHGGKLQAYQEKEKSFAAGDRIIFTKNDRLLQAKNGQIGEIKGVDERGRLIIETEGPQGKRELTIDPKRYPYLDHGYALTTHKAEGMTVDKVIYSADPKTMNYHEAYVAMTRGKKELSIYTPDKEVFRERMAHEEYKKQALELDQKISPQREQEKVNAQEAMQTPLSREFSR